MKTLNNFSLLIIATMLLVSCNKNGTWHCTHGNGVQATEIRQTAAFDGIELKMNADVILFDRDVAGVRIEASQNLIHLIETSVSGNTLVIEEKDGECVWDDESIKIFASTKTIESARIFGSGNITNVDPLLSSNLNISIDGHGDISLNHLTIDAYDIHIDGSGNVQLAGIDTASSGNILIRGSGDVSTIYLPTNKMSIDIAGSGDVNVTAINTLDVTIQGSGDVGYYGNPQLSTDISGSGSVIKK